MAQKGAYMDFLEKLSDTISEKGREVSEKVKEVSEITSLKRQIGICEDVIRKNYMEIGRRYYEKEGTEPGAEYEEFCKAISNAKTGLEDLEERIKEVKGI